MNNSSKRKKTSYEELCVIEGTTCYAGSHLRFLQIYFDVGLAYALKSSGDAMGKQ